MKLQQKNILTIPIQKTKAAIWVILPAWVWFILLKPLPIIQNRVKFQNLFATQFGYHIIKVIDKRPDVGQIEVAHIMIRTSSKMTSADSLKTKAKADSIFQLAKQGQDFSELAKKYSQDQYSAARVEYSHGLALEEWQKFLNLKKLPLH